MVPLLLSALAVTSVILLWKLPVWQLASKKSALTNEEYLNLQNEYRKTIAQIIGGLVVLGGVGFTWAQTVGTQRTLQLEQERLVTDRYSKAIDQVGAHEFQTRMGGIYALGKIAEQSEEYVSIVDNVLVAYLKQIVRDTGHHNAQQEIQAVLGIITHKKTHTKSNDSLSVSLQLNNLTFQGLAFNYAMLANANLNSSKFPDCSFIGADLSDVNCLAADFSFSNLTKANLSHGRFYDSKFKKCKARNVDFSNCDLRLADFKEADLTGAIFTNANLHEANFEGAILFDANLENAQGMIPNQLNSAKKNGKTKLPPSFPDQQ